jgi:glucoamylase
MSTSLHITVRLRRRLLAAALTVFCAALPAGAQSPPGEPGAAASWTTGAKTGLGTSATTDSKVWFTLGQGQLQEVFYPTVDIANLRSLDVLVVGRDGLVTKGVERRIHLADERSLTYVQTDTLPDRWRLTRTTVTDPDRPVVLIALSFEVLDGGSWQLFLHADPSLAGSGLCDLGQVTQDGALLFRDSGECDPQKVGKGRPVAAALLAAGGLTGATLGYAGSASDGALDLAADGRLDGRFTETSRPGNIVATAPLALDGKGRTTLALGFGETADSALAGSQAALKQGFTNRAKAYASGWHRYLGGLKPAPAVVKRHKLTALYNVALMGLKAHEDKTYPGANVASLSHPWGEAQEADLCCRHGYHAVWARDLYHVSTAQLAAGDRAAAERSLDYLLTVQQKPDGIIPQNTRLDGTPIWGGIQMDQIAFPALMAWQLGRTDAATWKRLKLSADYLMDYGPDTVQERWEENAGSSPSTLAAEIAGLIVTAAIADRNGDPQSAARYRETADLWQSRLKDWTVTGTGSIPGVAPRYFLRIARNGQPDKPDRITITNGGGNHDQRAIVDLSFLELTRLGVLPATDADIVGSLAVADAILGRPAAAGGLFYHRYNHDGYGETEDGSPYAGEGRGRLWPLLTGERGQYELLAGRDAVPWLLTLAATANDGLMLPEQVWDGNAELPGFAFGRGTGAATPLAWSMAQFVRLALSIDAGRPVDLPLLVAERYAAGPRQPVK